MKDLIVERIKKLHKHAVSAEKLGSLEEAEAFSSKVTALLMQHNLELSEIDLDEDKNKFNKWMYSEEVSFKDNQAGDRWKINLVRVLCKHNLCDFVMTPYTKTFEVYGRMENVDTVVWLFNYLSSGLMRLAQQANLNRTPLEEAMYGKNRYSFLKDWLIGAGVGIDKKLRLQQEESERASEITGLIHVNKKALDEFLKDSNPHVKQVKARGTKVGVAYARGFEAGAGYNITPPLKGSQTARINA